MLSYDPVNVQFNPSLATRIRPVRLYSFPVCCTCERARLKVALSHGGSTYW